MKYLLALLLLLFPLAACAQNAEPFINIGTSNPGSGGGTPAGSNFSVQVNSGGSFGGTGPGTSGFVLTSNGTLSAPSFQAATGGNPSLSAYSVLGNLTGSTAAGTANQSIILGTPGYTTSGVNFQQDTLTSNNFAQLSLQNLSSGSSASTDLVVGNNLATDSTNYADFGINSSVVNGSYPTGAGEAYLYNTSADLTLGCIGSNVLHLFTNSTDAMTIDRNQNVICGTGALATTATDGFLYIPSCAGLPTGTPTSETGRAPIVLNSSNNNLYGYSGGAWQNLTGSGGGGVSSFTGDSVVLNNSASTGAVTATLANAGAYTILGNNTSSSAAPTYTFGDFGIGTVSTTTTLTANSPSSQILTNTTAATVTLPAVSSCQGKVFTFFKFSGAGQPTITCSAGDAFSDATTSIIVNGVVAAQTFRIQSDGGTHWDLLTNRVLPVLSGGTGNGGTYLTTGGVVYGASATSFTAAAAGAAGSILTTTGATPSFTLTPGSVTPLTSLTAALVTAPTFINAITADTDAATITFNMATSNWHSVTLGGNRTLAFSGVVTGEDIGIILTQDATGSRTVTWPSGITWSYGGSAPTLQTVAGATDTISLKCYGTNLYYGYPIPSTAGGGGGVSSFTGDSVVLSNSASTGAVTATLANAAAYTGLINNTGSAAAPVYSFVPVGFQNLATSTTLTASSPTYNYVTAGGVTITLPVASTCIGKQIFVYNLNTTFVNATVARQASDVIQGGFLANGVTGYTLNTSTGISLMSTASGIWQIIQGNTLSLPTTGQTIANGAPLYVGSSGAMMLGASGTAGQLYQAGGPPSFTSTPGSGTSLTSITATHQIAGGTAPTVAVGAGAGTGGSPGATIAGHDTDFAVTLTTGTVIGTGTIFTVTFGNAYTTAPYVQVTSGNAAAAALMGGATQWYPTSTTTTMVLNSGTTGLTAAGAVYVFNVHCGQ